MPNNVYSVLFLCTGNSARSILAEGYLNHAGRGRFRAYSAGSDPKGEINPFALKVLASAGLPTEGYRSKSWLEFAAPDAPVMDFVFTVCDNATGEACPIWPGQPMTAHWGVPDPVAATGTDAEISLAFMEAYRMLSRRIDLFLALPLKSLDRMTISARLNEIGRHSTALQPS